MCRGAQRTFLVVRRDAAFRAALLGCAAAAGAGGRLGLLAVLLHLGPGGRISESVTQLAYLGKEFISAFQVLVSILNVARFEADDATPLVLPGGWSLIPLSDCNGRVKISR